MKIFEGTIKEVHFYERLINYSSLSSLLGLRTNHQEHLDPKSRKMTITELEFEDGSRGFYKSRLRVYGGEKLVAVVSAASKPTRFGRQDFEVFAFQDLNQYRQTPTQTSLGLVLGFKSLVIVLFNFFLLSSISEVANNRVPLTVTAVAATVLVLWYMLPDFRSIRAKQKLSAYLNKQQKHIQKD